MYLLWRTDAIKNGALIGEDKLGNKYYENHRYFVGRSRWVIYNDNVSYDYDGSQVTAEWYGWLHYKTDLPPTIVSYLTFNLIIQRFKCWFRYLEATRELSVDCWFYRKRERNGESLHAVQYDRSQSSSMGSERKEGIDFVICTLIQLEIATLQMKYK